MDDLQTLWNFLKEKFKESLSKVSYDTWIESASPIRITDNNIIIEVPSSLHKEYWENNLATRIVENIYEYSSREISPLFVIKNEQDTPANGNNVLRNEVPKKTLFKRDIQLNTKYTFDTFVIGKGNQMAHAAALVVAEEPVHLLIL